MNKLERRLIDLTYQQKLSHLSSTLSALPIIEEIYFTSDSAGETKIKFADFSC